jgi:hypothetical protein
MLKLLSLLLAILTWLALSSIQRESTPVGTVSLYSQKLTFFNVEVVILSSASDVHDYRVEPKTVESRSKATPKSCRAWRAKMFELWWTSPVSNPAPTCGSAIELSTPPGVKHVKVNPKEARVIFPTRH